MQTVVEYLITAAQIASLINPPLVTIFLLAGTAFFLKGK